MSLPFARAAAAQAAAVTPAGTPAGGDTKAARTVICDVQVEFAGSLAQPANANASGVETTFRFADKSLWQTFHSDAWVNHVKHLVASKRIPEGVEPAAEHLAAYGESHENLGKALVRSYTLLEYSNTFPVDLMINVAGVRGRVTVKGHDGEPVRGLLRLPANAGHQVIGGDGRSVYRFQQVLSDQTTERYANYDAKTLLAPVTHITVGDHAGTSLVPRNCPLFGLLAMNPSALSKNVATLKEQAGGVPFPTSDVNDCVASFHQQVLSKLPLQNLYEWCASLSRDDGHAMHAREGVRGISDNEALNQKIMTTPQKAWAQLRVELYFPE